jgi:hypothetical protein
MKTWRGCPAGTVFVSRAQDNRPPKQVISALWQGRLKVWSLSGPRLYWRRPSG